MSLTVIERRRTIIARRRTVIARRRLLAAAAAACGWMLTGGGVRVFAGEKTRGPVWLAGYAAAGSERRYGVAAFDADGRILFACPLPGRAHGVTPHPDGTRAVVMARRPGRWFALLDLRRGALIGEAVTLPDDRRGTGHGVFNADGSTFYMVEDDVTRGTGVVTVLDPAAAYARRGDFDAGGVGPHEVIALDGGRTLAVADGGVLTHPDTGRAKLNLDEMRPALVYLDAGAGRVTQTVRLPADCDNLGIRHLAAATDGTVIFAMQDERPTGDIQPLIGLHRQGDAAPRLLSAPDAVWRRFAGYVGSVAVAGATVAASSPRGGVIGLWDGGSGDFIGLTELPDGCGLAAAGPDGGFTAGSGRGRIIRADAPGTGTGAPGTAGADTPGYRWDNHFSPPLFIDGKMI